MWTPACQQLMATRTHSRMTSEIKKDKNISNVQIVLFIVMRMQQTAAWQGT
jgi:hypothetical protein